MKKIYQKPEMMVVKLQHQSFICQSTRSISSDEVGYGGASSNNTGNNVRTKESGGVWDEEW